MRKIHFHDLGNIEYGKAWDLQEQMLKVAVAEKSRRITEPGTPEVQIDNYLLFCEHPHVYTLGKSGHMENLLVNDAQLEEMGAVFYKTNRGGDITYHGPGQIVGYPVLDLEQFFTDLGLYMRSLEQVIINTVAHYGINGERLDGSTGVWIDVGTPQVRKICAMGVRASRWVTIHGFALNVNSNMSYFENIVACGIDDKGVTSIQKELGREIDEQEVKELLKKEFAMVFESEIINETALSFA